MQDSFNVEKKINKEFIKDKIYIIRNQKVMLDSDLAKIYGYTTKAFNQQVKNNINKFDDDFRFQLTDEEVFELRSKNFTSNFVNNKRGGRTYRPYVFTEQGIYMLMTVLKGNLAIRQSKAIIRLFKDMKDYLIESDRFNSVNHLLQLSIQTTENTKDIKNIKENMATKKDLIKIMKEFINSNNKEILILNGQTVEGNIAYSDIYESAKKSIYIIDNYIGLKTLALLKCVKKGIKIIIFSDNLGKSLHEFEYEDFIKEYPNINVVFKRTNNIIHDRYIIIDYKQESEQIYHCGSSSKDIGKRITTISKVEDKEVYYSLIDLILKNRKLLLN